MTQSFNVNVSGTFTPVTHPFVNLGGTWTPVSIGWVNVGGTWTEFFVLQPTVVASPLTVSARGFAPISLTTGNATAVASGGTGSYTTYQWSFSIGGSGITITSPNTSVTSFQASLQPGQNFTGQAICTVTDSGGNIGVSNAVGVTIAATN